MRLSDEDSLLSDEDSTQPLASPLTSQLRLSEAKNGVLVLSEVVAGSKGPSPLRIRRCPVVLDAKAMGLDVAFSGVWASRGCVFPVEGDMYAERVTSFEAHLEFPNAAPDGKAHRVDVDLPALARGLVESAPAPDAGIARDEFLAALRGGKRKEVPGCGGMLPLVPGSGASAPLHFCYSLGEMSSFQAAVKGTPAAPADAALKAALKAAAGARAAALDAMAPEEAAAMRAWLDFGAFDESVQRALIRLAYRIHPSQCGKKAEDKAACAASDEVRTALSATLPAGAMAEFDAVFGAEGGAKLDTARQLALSRHQLEAGSGKDPARVVDVYDGLFRVSDSGSWYENDAPDFLADAAVSRTDAEVSANLGVRGAVLLAVAPAGAARVSSASDGGWLLTLGGGLPLATVFSLKGDGGTEGTSGGVPLRPLPVAKPEPDGNVTSGSSDAGRVPSDPGRGPRPGKGSPAGTTVPAGDVSGRDEIEPVTRAQVPAAAPTESSSGSSTESEPRREQASAETGVGGTATCVVR